MRFHSLAEWLHWQEGLHPSEIDLGLERVAAVYQNLGLDFSQVYVITVAGTNGKGSSVALLCAILRYAGFRVGCYSSPHLLRYNERIQVNAQTIDDASLVRLFAMIDAARFDISLTYFEFGTLAALAYFCEQACDIVVLEVGLGGRLDAVNIIDADLALITNIDLDHCEWLGDTREKIAVEKAGILRVGAPMVCGDQAPPVSLVERSKQLEVKAFYSQRDFRWQRQSDRWDWDDGITHWQGLPLPNLAGEFQVENAAAVLKCVRLLPSAERVSRQAVEFGLTHFTVPGRLQFQGNAPRRVLDVGHNPHAAKVLATWLRPFRDQGRILGVFSMLQRKDVTGVVALLAPIIDAWYIAPLKHGGGISMEELHATLTGFGAKVFVADAIGTAWRMAVEASDVEATVIGFGSFYTVAEILTAGKI